MTHQDLIAKLKAALPDESLESISQALLKELHPLPEWSTLQAPQVRVDKTGHSGAFSWCYYTDPRKTRPEPMVVLAKRGKNLDANNNPQLGAIGGYVELGTETTAGERPKEGAVREAREETVDDKGIPVFDIAEDRLKLVISDIDYRKTAMPVHYVGHGVSLSKQEFEAISAHAEKLQNDPAYLAAVKEQTHGEVVGFEILPLSKALTLKPEQFAHPHELVALKDLAASLQQSVSNGRS